MLPALGSASDVARVSALLSRYDLYSDVRSLRLLGEVEKLLVPDLV
jgi:hypothetical protein